MKMQPHLYRNNSIIHDFLSAIGSFKETKFTAYLAYLISAFPDMFGQIFIESNQTIEHVSIEQVTSNNDRYDIVLETNRSIIVIEAKMAFQQDIPQIKRYLINQKGKQKQVTLCLLDYGSYGSLAWSEDIRRAARGIKIIHVTWKEIYNCLKRLLRHKSLSKINAFGYYFADELIKYMEVNNMNASERKEIYCRDLMTPASVELFFKYHIYISQPKFYNSAQGNLYFAPYFTGRAPRLYEEMSSVKISEGISYIAQIFRIEIVNTRYREVEKYLRDSGLKDSKRASKALLAYADKSRKDVMIFVLGEPLRGFLTPIKKKQLNINGAMGARSFTFNKLFEILN